MAVVWIREDWVGRGGDADKDGTTYKRAWKIKTDNKWDDANTIKNDPLGVANLPDYLDPHSSNFFAKCRKLTIDQEADSPFFHKAAAEYSTKPTDPDPPDPNPLARPAKIRWSSSQYEKYSEEDRDGNAILNPTGDRFEEMPNIDDSRWGASVSKNVAPPLPTWVLQANNRLNSAEFVIGGLTVAAELAKLQGLAISELKQENDVEFHEFSFDIHYRDDGWTTKLPNLSFNHYDVGAGAKSSVRVATTTSGVLANDFQNGSVVDGVTLVTGDSVCIKDQLSGIQNGYYTVAASGAPTRRDDFATDMGVAGFICVVEEGAVNARTAWEVTNASESDVVDTDAIVFAAFVVDPASNVIKRPVKIDGQRPSDTQQVYPNGIKVEFPTIATATFTEFDRYHLLDFSNLPLT